MSLDLSSLPSSLSGLFGELIDGSLAGRFYSAADAREVEQHLAEYGVSYKTRIVRSRKRGVYYLITLLETTHDLAYT